MPRTSFEALSHGFHFRNADIRWSFGMVGGTQLCGGLAFGSLDHFYHRLTIPPDFNPPAEGTPLHNYIVARQMDAHNYAIPRLIAGDRRFRGNAFEAGLRVDQNFGVVKRSIDARRPIPVLLSSARNSLSTGSHWVVATGYELLSTSTYGCAIMTKLYLYDSNRPNVESELEPHYSSSTFKIKGSGSQYGYYAPFDEYAALNPSSPADFNRRPSTTRLATDPFNFGNPRF